MPKKKKKSRASTAVQDTASTSFAGGASNQNQNQKSSSSPPVTTDLISLRLVKSSTSPTTTKSLKFSPLILLNQVDAEHLDVMAGDQVFLLATREENGGSRAAKDDDGMVLEETAIARVQIATNTAANNNNNNNNITHGSPVKSPMASPRSSQRSKLVPGCCHVFPPSLADSLLLGGGFADRGPDHTEPSAAASTTTPVSRTPISTTPTPTPTPALASASKSASKSKFSFAKGGGGDALISPTKNSTPSGGTPKNNRTPTTPSSSSKETLSNSTSSTSSTSSRTLWIVPLDSTLGDRIAPTLCRRASSLLVQESTEPFRLEKSSSSSYEPRLVQRLVVAHTIGSHLGIGMSFSLSFQGQSTDCNVQNLEQGELLPSINSFQQRNEVDDDGCDVDVDVDVTEKLAALTLDGMDDKEQTASALLQSIRRFTDLEKAPQPQKLLLYKITNSTAVTICNNKNNQEGTQPTSASASASTPTSTSTSIEQLPEIKTLVVGLDATVEQVQALVIGPLLHPELFQKTSLRPPKGMLLHGASGTGKSSLVRQVAHNLQSRGRIHVEHIHCTALQSQTAMVGQAERHLVDLFRSAQRNRPKSGCLMILDDVHLICPRRQGTDLGADRLSSTLLALLDGIDENTTSSPNTNTNTGIDGTGTGTDASFIESYPMFIVAVTTNPSLLDPALRRPGRLDSEVEVPLPDDPATRGKILQFQMESLGATISSDLLSSDWLEIARLAKGFTGADLKLAAKEALRSSSHGVGSTYDDDDNNDNEMKEGGNIVVSRVDIEKALRSTKPSAIKAVTVEIPQVHWSSIGGMEEVKRQLREAIELPLTHGHMFKQLGIRPPRGVLLYGPPGCSKTLMARALATEGQMNFLAVKGPELLSKWLGESERALASLFRRARLASPCVIFFDEIDAIASKRGGSNSGGERLLSQLLTELDGIHGSDDDSLKKRRVVVVCATNRPDLLDSALMRPGRIDRMIYVGVPDVNSRHRILQIGLQGKACADDIDISRLAEEDISGGLSGAEVVSACRDAALMAIEEEESEKECGKPRIRASHMFEALSSIERQITAEMLYFYSQFQGNTTLLG